MTQPDIISPPPHRISKFAVGFALLTVFGAVVFGIYGPKIADRLTLLGGVPLGEVVEAAANLRLKAIFLSQRDKQETSLNQSEQNAELSRLLGRTYHLPNLADAGYQLKQVSPASLPGAPFRAAELVYQSTTPDNQKWLVLYLAADDGQFLTFDELGRTHQFAPDNVVWEDISTSSEDASLILIWSDGQILYLACVEDDDEAEKLRPHFDTP